MPLKKILFSATLLSVIVMPSTASESAFYTIIRKPKPVTEELFDKKLYVTFPDSELMTNAVRKELRARGYTLVDAESDATDKLVFRSKFIVMGKGLSQVEGTFGDIVEAKKNLAPTEKNYSNQTVGLDHVAISAAATGGISSISVTDFGMWLTQKMGIAGRFNEMLTGDPRGFCLSESCNKFKQIVNLLYTGAAIGYVHVAAENENIVLDRVSEAALATLLDTFPRKEIKSPEEKQAGVEPAQK